MQAAGLGQKVATIAVVVDIFSVPGATLDALYTLLTILTATLSKEILPYFTDEETKTQNT